MRLQLSRRHKPIIQCKLVKQLMGEAPFINKINYEHAALPCCFQFIPLLFLLKYMYHLLVFWGLSRLYHSLVNLACFVCPKFVSCDLFDILGMWLLFLHPQSFMVFLLPVLVEYNSNTGLWSRGKKHCPGIDLQLWSHRLW